MITIVILGNPPPWEVLETLGQALMRDPPATVLGLGGVGEALSHDTRDERGSSRTLERGITYMLNISNIILIELVK